MRRIVILGVVLAAAATTASAALAADPIVPFPAPKVLQVFVAAQTVNPAGAMTNYFAPGDTVVFRAYAADPKTKQLVAAKDMRYFYVKLPDQSHVKLAFNPSAAGASQGFPWTGTWTVPASYASGTVEFKVLIKLKNKRQGQFVQMPVSSAMLTIAAKPAATFGSCPGRRSGHGRHRRGVERLALRRHRERKPSRGRGPTAGRLRAVERVQARRAGRLPRLGHRPDDQ